VAFVRPSGYLFRFSGFRREIAAALNARGIEPEVESDRPMVGSSSFGGTIQVVAAPEPSAWAMMLLGLVSLRLAGPAAGQNELSSIRRLAL
jgi:hypothetical protein